jgi:REP element-mobilizing transposase RayT
MLKLRNRRIVVQASSLPKTAEEIAAASEPQLAAGSCVLRSPEIAGIVQNALVHFDQSRYILSAWCIMPNHVHVVVTPIPDHSLSSILHSWKSFTASKVNKALGLGGRFWERESFDHLIHSFDDWAKYVKYTQENPVLAGLCAKPEDWLFSSCGAGFQPAFPAGFELIDPRSTPFVAPRSRGELPHLYKQGCAYFITFCQFDVVASK